jgi:hypothetical protein
MRKKKKAKLSGRTLRGGTQFLFEGGIAMPNRKGVLGDRINNFNASMRGLHLIDSLKPGKPISLSAGALNPRKSEEREDEEQSFRDMLFSKSPVPVLAEDGLK